MKTIKELSDAVGISRVSIYKMLKRDDIKGHVFKKDNVTVVNEIGENIIRAHYSQECVEAVDMVFNELNNETDDSLNDDLMAVLREQLREKDNQINSLLNIVANQQRVQAAQYIVDKQHTETAQKPIKKSFWNRFKK